MKKIIEVKAEIENALEDKLSFELVKVKRKKIESGLETINIKGFVGNFELKKLIEITDKYNVSMYLSSLDGSLVVSFRDGK